MVIKLSNAFLAKTRELSTWTSNPNRALEAMRRIMRQTVKTLKAECVVDLLQDLCNKHTPLRAVRLQSEKMCSGLRKNRAGEIENKVMKWRLKDAKWAE